MTIRSRNIRLVLSLALLLAALHGVAENGGYPLGLRTPEESCVWDGWQDCGQDGDPEGVDFHPLVPLLLGLYVAIFFGLPPAVASVSCMHGVLLSSDFRSRVFHPPSA